MYRFIANSMLIFVVTLPNGLIRNIEFEASGRGVYSYMTDCKAEADAIRRHPLLKAGRIIDESEPEAVQQAKVEKEKKEEENALRFDNITKAKNYLQKTFKVDVRKLKSPDSVKEKAKELGVTVEF